MALATSGTGASGTLFLPPQPCPGWGGAQGPGGYFLIGTPDQGEPIEDGPRPARTSCYGDAFWIEAGASRMQGSCWVYDATTCEDRVVRDLNRVGSTDPE